MTTDAPSRAAPPTLQDVLGAIAVADLTRARRQDLASAVRTAARALRRQPQEIPVEPVLLAKRLAGVAPIPLGISPARWANVRSLLNKALALTRPMLPGRHREPLSAEWKAQSDKLARGHATRLSRLLHWLSARSIQPSAVSEGHLLQFSEELRNASLAKKPEQTWLEVAWVWNKASRQITGWPGVVIPIPKRRQTYTFPWSAFPSSLKADVDRYLNRLSGCDLTEDVPFRPVRPATRHLRERQLRTFACALVQRGRDPTTIRALADLVALDAYKEGLRFFLDRRRGTSSGIVDLACSLKSVAKHWVKADAATLDAMSGIIRRLSVERRGMTTKNRDRLRPLEDPAIRHAFVNLPLRLMRMAKSGKLRPKRAALLAQTAVAIEILLMAPMRMRNLINLDLDRHLVRPARTRGDLHIVIPGAEVKNGSELDYPLPEESASLIGWYLERYRPLLASAENRALFPGSDGVKSERTLALQITKAVFHFVGITVNTHLFRHICAKLYLDQHPGEYAVVARALGNRSIDVTATHYTGLETAAAVRHFDQTILSLRQRDPEP